MGKKNWSPVLFSVPSVPLSGSCSFSCSCSGFWISGDSMWTLTSSVVTLVVAWPFRISLLIVSSGRQAVQGWFAYTLIYLSVVTTRTAEQPFRFIYFHKGGQKWTRSLRRTLVGDENSFPDELLPCLSRGDFPLEHWKSNGQSGLTALVAHVETCTCVTQQPPHSSSYCKNRECNTERSHKLGILFTLCCTGTNSSFSE